MPNKHKLSLFRGYVEHHKNREGAWVGTSPSHQLRTIEATQYSDLVRVVKKDEFTNLVDETWSDDNIQQWLNRNPMPAVPPLKKDIGERQGSIKLLFCQEEWHDKVCYYMSLASFEASEEELDLPAQTLPNLANRWGINAREFEVTKDGGIKSLDITIRTAKTTHIPVFGLALSYDFKKRTSRAFIRGTNAIVASSELENVGGAPLVRRFHRALERIPHLWSHPLVLPLILLEVDISLIREISRKHLHVTSDDIRGSLNTSDYDAIAALLGGLNSDADAHAKRAAFTNRINSILCDAIDVRRRLLGARNMAAFLLATLDQLEKKARKLTGSALDADTAVMNQQIEQWIQTLDDGASGFERGIEAILATLQAQLDVLGTITSQLDSVRSAQMAAQAGLDSVAMKTLAVVTAVFLPATFIATLFSMSMFNWQTGEDSEGETVSGKFWIFWVVALPVTFVVLGLWWLWWNVSRFFYAEKFRDAGHQPGDLKMGGLVGWTRRLRETQQRLKRADTEVFEWSQVPKDRQ